MATKWQLKDNKVCQIWSWC